MSDKHIDILVIRFSALGDVAMTIPVLYSVARQHPHVRLYVVTRPFFAQLFLNKPGNLFLLTVDLSGRNKGVHGMLALLRKLSRLHVDVVVDLHNVLRSWVIDLFYMLRGIRVVMVQKHRFDRHKLLKEKCYRPHANFIERYAAVFARLGCQVKLDFRSLFDGNKTGDLPFVVKQPAIGVAPFARYYNKTYPLQLMRRVVEMLVAQGFYVYLFGGKGKEAELLDSWSESCNGCVSLAGKLAMEKELTVMSRLHLMITMDSANQHLASLVGTKTVTVWGSTTPVCGFLGYGQSLENAVCLDIPCQPCSIAGGNTCNKKHFQCLKDIEPKMIVHRVKQILE